jgi:hypothetical protein
VAVLHPQDIRTILACSISHCIVVVVYLVKTPRANMALKAFKANRAAPSAAHIEESPSAFETGSDPESKEPPSGLKLDASGLPLVPQPSDHKDDPLVCRDR